MKHRLSIDIYRQTFNEMKALKGNRSWTEFVLEIYQFYKEHHR